VLLNFSRDQLDRNHEIKFLGRAWREALRAAAGENGSGRRRQLRRSADHVGQPDGRPSAVSVGRHGVHLDAPTPRCAPQCGYGAAAHQPVRRVRPPAAGTAPGATSPNRPADYVVRPADRIRTCPTVTGRLAPACNVPGKPSTSPTRPVRWRRPSRLGVDPSTDALRGLHATVRSPAGPVLRGDVRRRPRPAAGAEQEPGRLGRVDCRCWARRPVDLAIDSVAADGKDVSWLWDVDFEQLRGTSRVDLLRAARPTTWPCGSTTATSPTR
jgi:hypothetical protein